MNVVVLALSVAGAALAGCAAPSAAQGALPPADRPVEPRPEEGAPGEPDPDGPPTPDDLLYRVSEVYPDFGGLYLRGGHLYVLVRGLEDRRLDRLDRTVGPAEEAAIAADVVGAVRAVFGDDLGGLGRGGPAPGPTPTLFSADHSFKELRDWSDAFAGRSPGAVASLGVNVEANRVQVAVESEGQIAGVEAELDAAGVPAGAREVFVVGHDIDL